LTPDAGPGHARHVAHFNYGTMIAPLGDPAVAGFVDRIDLVHRIASRSAGHVWHYEGDQEAEAAAMGRRIADTEDPIICSFSVWRSVADFEHFLHKTAHGHFLRRRAEWFLPGRSEMVMWMVPQGHIPPLSEALDRLDQLRADGPGDEVFTLGSLRAGRGAAAAG
jgi:hypothetical protein